MIHCIRNLNDIVKQISRLQVNTMENWNFFDKSIKEWRRQSFTVSERIAAAFKMYETNLVIKGEYITVGIIVDFLWFPIGTDSFLYFFFFHDLLPIRTSKMGKEIPRGNEWIVQWIIALWQYQNLLERNRIYWKKI